jgi:hypothetical protein
MDMTREAIEKIEELAENKTYEIDGETYSDRVLHRIAPHIDRPQKITVNGLDSAVKLIKAEIAAVTRPLFVRVNSHKEVSIFTTYNEPDFERCYLYSVVSDVPEFKEGFRDQQKAIIELRSKFMPNEGVDYLIDLLSKITKDNSVSSNDNGVTQTVEARQGIALAQKVTIKPRVALKPFRTFLEVEQPESEFLLRLDENGNIGFFEADGGMWKMEAKTNIAAYFKNELSELIREGIVIVMM